MKRVQFEHSAVPYLFIAPQILIISIFFLWPAAQALYQSFLLEDAFGMSSQFVWFRNFEDVLTSSSWTRSAIFTVVFSVLVSVLSIAISLFLAVRADEVIRGAKSYKTLLMWGYAIAPPVAGLLGIMMFNPLMGDLYKAFNSFGFEFNHIENANDAAFIVILIAVWKQVSVNFIFFLSGLQGIPKSVQEAATLDCKSPERRFWTITFPLLAPTTFFLLVINLTYAFFETFGIIDVSTKGAPGGSTATLVYKVYVDGFLGADMGGSAAQSVLLMIMVSVLTVFQFRFIERKVHY
ncbi:MULTISPECIES: ABC transporter permease subunit [Thalassospira]|jgi:sn-glycerol 3-phosphate transport system permease protein|uniref:ABC transporter permease subunit n=1 Tax=Thalassospira TaxID=168934 RepID=UPI0002873A35|nr:MULTISPECIES: ABC transporter permease subunit [Thalassospira]EKF07439.1 glycerol-3-phosphate ABC transporter permease [Thalassospira profundimaris WP0211]KXJ57557.1 MAG: glycerol-3-phosphate transporter permease [Thalassospira sp. Nap_22]QPO13618.1 ABC transporter permease subunit [Thalassospira sp. A40-3]BDW89023.1 glycerol-3-phosphate transporter permease [Thalassospira tepidiphila]|tara:strand:- start:418 stop:1296 length:879 start_codon:yes stop_codon:yes gene_type:complete